MLKPISREKLNFLLKNLLKGLLYFAIIVILFLFARKNLSPDNIEWLSPIYQYPVRVFLIFFLSEILVGIIPPEIFMFWSLSFESISIYVENVVLLASISYAAGLFAYWLGRKFNQTVLYRFLKIKYFKKYIEQLNKYGAFIIIVAALTPLPWSGICLLIGSVNLSLRKFLYFSLFRFLRFAVYATIIWEANILQ